MTRKPRHRRVISWTELNERLRTATEKQVLRLLKDEQRGKHRLVFLMRLHSRYTVLRRQRERREWIQCV